MVDVRDLWPDIYVGVFPGVLRRLVRAALEPLFADCARTFRRATSLVAISEPILSWAISASRGRIRRETDRSFHLAYDRGIDRGDASSAADAAFAEFRRDKLVGKTVVCFIGTTSLRMELDTLVDASALLESRGRRDIQVVIAGRGEALPRLREKAAGLGNVHFTGWLGQRDLRSLLEVATMGILPYPSTSDFMSS